MDQHSIVVGLDVHKVSITAAILPPTALRPSDTYTIENNVRAVERLVKRIAGHENAVFVYEAGPCG